MKSRLIIRDGHQQLQRHLPALRGDYFQPNEMRFEALLTLASEYAGLMRFYQLDLSHDGDWHQYFHADETILLATVLAFKTDELNQKFTVRLQQQSNIQSWASSDTKFSIARDNRDAINSPLLLARLLDHWLISASSIPGRGAVELRQLILGVLRGLHWEMQALLHFSAGGEANFANATFSPQFLYTIAWHENAKQPNQAEQASKRTLVEFKHNFHALSQALRMVQQSASRLLPETCRSGEHDPASSLLITFIELFQKLLSRLNRFTDRHLDFYYQDVLRMKPKAQQPDSAYLVVYPLPSAKKIDIAKGTTFVAKLNTPAQELEQEFLFEAEQDSVLNDAKVVALHTLFFDQQAASSAESRETLASYWREIPLPASTNDTKELEKLLPVPLMGAPKPGEKISDQCHAKFGFAIASKILLMREGLRTVRAFFQYASKKEHSLMAHLGLLAHKLSQHQGGKDGGKSQQSAAAQESYIFIQLFRYMFRISLSTSDGWYVVPEYRPAYHGLDPNLPPECLAIEFDLPTSVAAIVAYQPIVHGAGYETSLPVMRFEMQKNDYYYPYELLKNFLIKDIRIEVDVKSCRQLLLHNQIGQLSSLSPFLPFGPLPSVGAYLIVGYEELRYKQLLKLDLKIEWAGLPNNLGGFRAHYRGYSQPLNSGDVLASIGVLTDGKWHFDAKPTNLFQYRENQDGSASNLVNPESLLSFKSIVRYQKPLVNQFTSATNAPFTFAPSTTGGLFKLRLDTPENAFGHQEYPHLLSQVLTQNALLKKAARQSPLPNPPYTPQINSVSLNYSAQTTLNFQHIDHYELPTERDKFMHLHPLGIQDIVPTEHKLISQIACYHAPANLFIGLQATQFDVHLTLYFYLQEDSLPIKRKNHLESSTITWSYLSDNKWIALSQAQVIDDTTHGFMTSGIITLHLPGNLPTDNTIMPSGVAWLRVSAHRHMEKFCSLMSVFAQAIKVSACDQQVRARATILPAFSIQKSQQNITGVDHIVQIQSTFGGKRAEQPQQFRTRASERLRHKNRALCSRDYELLILENFPEIFKVKCFANMCSALDPSKRQRPGHILIVAIPHLSEGSQSNQKPTLSGHLILRVQEFIEQLAPLEAKISVENPAYEEIQVRCTIRLDGQHKAGKTSERINQALCNYLSPWSTQGQNQHFGWSIQEHDIVAFLLDQEGVIDVSGVSLLQINQVGDPLEKLYSLIDSANPKHAQTDLSPMYPWSIAVPMNLHSLKFIEQNDTRQFSPKAIGVEELRIGSTFIISTRKAS